MSFRLKTILGIALIEAVLLALLVATSLSFLETSNEEQLVERARTSARLFATTTKDAVLSTDLASLETFVQEMLGNPGVVYARVVSDVHGVLAMAGDRDALSRPFEADEKIADVDDDIFDTAVVISEGGMHFGQVELGVSVGAISELLSAAKSRMAVIAMVEMALVAFFSAMLGLYLTRQLDGLRRAACAIAEGDLSATVPTRSRDELGQVASAFNAMVSRLRESLQTRDRYARDLEALNVELEERVRMRTAKLQAANAALEESSRNLAQAQAQLIQSAKMASVGQLAAGVAHEINNPIAFIGANLKELERCIEDLTQVVHACEQAAGDSSVVRSVKSRVKFDEIMADLPEMIRDSGEGVSRVRDIVAGLKGFSHVGGSDFRGHDLHTGLNATVGIARNTFRHHVTIIRDYGDLPLVECVPSQLDQVFMNLLVNAGQAVDGEGTITLRTGHVADRVFVEVEDDGCGIPADVQKRLFEPFFTTKPVGTGTGLGLSISYGIVERHGGRIEVESSEGQGARFRVWLPVEQHARTDCPAAASAA